MIVENDSEEWVDFYWLDYEGSPVFYAATAPGDKFEISTYSTHPWALKFSDNDEFSIIFVVNTDSLDELYMTVT